MLHLSIYCLGIIITQSETDLHGCEDCLLDLGLE